MIQVFNFTKRSKTTFLMATRLILLQSLALHKIVSNRLPPSNGPTQMAYGGADQHSASMLSILASTSLVRLRGLKSAVLAKTYEDDESVLSVSAWQDTTLTFQGQACKCLLVFLKALAAGSKMLVGLIESAICLMESDATAGIRGR